MNRKLAAALSGAALVLALAGCGDEGDSKELDAWSKGFCGSIKPHIAGAQKARDDIAQVRPDEKPAALKKRLSEDIDALAKSNSELAEDIGAAGPPPVEDGEQRQKDAVKERRDVAKSYAALKKQVDGLETGEQSKFAEGLKGVGGEIEKLGAQRNVALTKLQSGDVGRSMAKEQGCKPAASSSATPPGSPSATSGSTDQPTPSPSKK